MKRLGTLKVGVAAAALLCLSTPSLAQDQPARPAASAAGSEELVVTARKREEKIQNVPISITAVGEQTLENRSVYELIDLQRQIPGFQVSMPSGSAVGQVLTIRGQGQADTLLTTDASVGVYVDGVNNPRSFGLSSILQDVERVEVLRGPQGTLFGKNTTGGAVSIVTKRATPEYGGWLRTIVGSDDAIDVTALVNLPLGENAGLRLFGRQSTRDGFAVDSAGRQLNGEDLVFLRARLDADISDRFSITLTGDYSRNKTGGGAIQLVGYQFGGNMHAEVAAQVFQGAPTLARLNAVVPLLNSFIIQGGLDRTSGGQQQISEYESWGASADLNYEVSDNINFRSITGYRELSKRDVEDLDGTPYLVLQPDLQLSYQFFSQELQLVGGSDTLQWVVGGYYGKETGNDGSVTPALPFLNPANPNVFDADVDNSSMAVFGQATWDFAPQWSLTGGLRWTKETKGMVSRNHFIIVPFQDAPPIATATGFCRIDPAQLDNPAICQASFEDEFSAVSWLASLDYQINEDTLVYVSISEGFRGGGQNLRGTPTTGSFSSFEPETARNYEFGVKSTFADGRVRVNAAVFMVDYKDVQRSIIFPGVPPATGTGNAAQATLTGGEVEATWNPIDPLTFTFTAAYLNGEYDEYINIGDGLDHSNDPWPAPEWTYSASARYVAPTSVGDLAFQVDYNHSDAVSGLIAGTNPLLAPFLQGRDTDLLNARISLNIDSINGQVAVFSRNLLDKDYYTTSLNVLGAVTRYAGYPRFIGVEFKVAFGSEAD